MTIRLLVPADATAPPLDPSAQDARQQLVRELAKPEYQQARPSLIDIIEKWITDWLNSIQPANGTGFAQANLLPVLGIGALVVALIVAFLIFGLPRLNRRSRVVGALFGDEDERDSVTLRASAERAAAAGDYSTAIAEGFRSIARGLAERTVVTTFPGTTAHGFAETAAASFPASTAELRASADAFDGVRYLDSVGTQEQWLGIRDLERALRSARPVLEGVPA
jgi:hypothetical protein